MFNFNIICIQVRHRLKSETKTPRTINNSINLNIHKRSLIEILTLLAGDDGPVRLDSVKIDYVKATLIGFDLNTKSILIWISFLRFRFTLTFCSLIKKVFFFRFTKISTEFIVIAILSFLQGTFIRWSLHIFSFNFLRFI